jgi:hypothetical protein
MHTEHLTHVRPVRVSVAWLIAIAVASLAGLLLASVGSEDGPGTAGAALAMAGGFFAGGFFAGFRSMHAPILHGVALGLVSLVAWVLLNLIARGASPGFEWEALTPTAAGAILLAQMAAGVAGAWTGYRLALRGQPEPED